MASKGDAPYVMSEETMEPIEMEEPCDLKEAVDSVAVKYRGTNSDQKDMALLGKHQVLRVSPFAFART